MAFAKGFDKFEDGRLVFIWNGIAEQWGPPCSRIIGGPYFDARRGEMVVRLQSLDGRASSGGFPLKMLLPVPQPPAWVEPAAAREVPDDGSWSPMPEGEIKAVWAPHSWRVGEPVAPLRPSLRVLSMARI